MEHADRAMTQLMEFYKVVIQRTHGNGTKFIKFHLVRHFVVNILDLGVMPNFDSGPPESNHKVNGKQTSERTQLRADLLEAQTAKQYYQNLVIDWGSDALPGAVCLPKVKAATRSCLLGARFTFQVDEGPDGDHNVVSFQWWSKDIHELYPARYTTWLIHHFFSQLADGTVVRGCTEHKRENIYLFRAHPAYRGHNQWHDWALFEWANDAGETGDDADDEPYTIPGQIILFLDLPASAVGMDVGEETRIESAGMYALIETLEDPLPLRSKRTEIVVPSKKKLTAAQQRKRRRDHRRVITPNIFLVPVETIYEPISALPDIGGEVGDFIFVRPADTWSYCFSDFIDMCHDD